jgi:hypothetical protein
MANICVHLKRKTAPLAPVTRASVTDIGSTPLTADAVMDTEIVYALVNRAT